MSRSHKRRGQRMKTRLKALYSSEGQSGDAMLTEISYSGARLECAGIRPPRGRSVCVYVWLESQDEPFELEGHVAGLRHDGFAIEYEKPGQDVCLMVDLAAAVIDEAAASDAPADDEPPVAKAVVPKQKPPPLSDLVLSAYELLELEQHSDRVTEAIAARRRAMKEKLAAASRKQPQR